MGTPGKKLTDQEKQRVIRLRKVGLSIQAIAREQRIGTATVRRILETPIDK